MKLSFVIPAHNEEKYIGKCLDSIIRELKGKPYETEIIVVNNASTDRTEEIARSYPNVTVVDEPAKGLVKARSRGFRETTGDLIANIDADTILPRGWIDKVFKEFSKNPKLICLSGPHINYDLSPFVRFLTKLFYAVTFLVYLVNKFILNGGSFVQGGNFVCRRTALLSVGGYDVNIEFYGEDADIARRLHKLGDVKFTFGLPIYASGRRLATEGLFTIALRYTINYFWITFFKKPYSKTSVDVRLEDDNSRLKYLPKNKKKEWLIGAMSFGILSFILVGFGFMIYHLIQ
jgi:glycosyltransferase involved in cell wall biosynthesis